MKPKLVAGGLVCVVCALLAVLFAVSDGRKRREHQPVGQVVRTSSVVRSQSNRPPGSAPRLASDINRAERIIDDRTSSSGDLAGAGLLEQLATGVLARETAGARRATLALLRPQAAAAMRTDLTAGALLSRLIAPKKQFPRWRITQPPRPGTLLAYFRQAQSRFGVRWQYLAAIEFVESRFGRIHGASPAGAQGPMQFLPSTWAQYGSGSIDNPRDAILAAGRYLVANGAPGDMGAALYSYNHSPAYVAAVKGYAGRMRADPRAYDGYYNWQVLFARVNGVFILPVGYPRVRPQSPPYP